MSGAVIRIGSYLLAAAAAGSVIGMSAGCGGAVSPLGSTQPNLQTPALDGGRAANIAAAGLTAAPGTTRRAGVFVTGGAPAGYVHAWVTLHKIEVVDTSNKPATVWESREGMAVDLATLRDARGPLYAVVTSADVPSGRSHKRIRVTIGKSVLLYEPGSTVAKTVLLSDALPRDDEGRPVLSYTLAHARDLGSGKEDIVVAFDPAKMVLNGDRVKVAAGDGSRAARRSVLADTSRQIPGIFAGVVEDAAREPEGGPAAKMPTGAAPAEPHGGGAAIGRSAAGGSSPAPMAVASTATGTPVGTAPVGTAPVASAPASGASPAALAPRSTPGGREAKDARDADTAGTFTLKDADDRTLVIQPDKNVVPLDLGSAAATPAADKAGGADSGKTAMVASGKRVWVRGVLAEDSKRILASEIVVLPAPATAMTASTDDAAASTDTGAAALAAPDEAAVIGAASAAKPEASTFTLAERQVYGLVPAQSAVTVVLGKDAALVRLQGGGSRVTPDDLFAALKRPDTAVEAAGTYDPVTGTLTASRVTLQDTVSGSAPEAGAGAASPAAGAQPPATTR